MIQYQIYSISYRCQRGATESFSNDYVCDSKKQGCGSGSGLDPDSMGCLDPDPDSESESCNRIQGQEKEENEENTYLNLYIKISLIFF
jgi:hypothetical protein